jgi:NADH:ubiquinone oxidoreductase subunit
MNIGTRLFTLLHGREVGTDSAGNRYFIEKRAVAGRRQRRWVWYAGPDDPTRIPPEWYGWMHYTLDEPLPENNRRAWQKPHLPNVTGTAAAYRPPGHDYSGGRRAVTSGDYEAWTPDA